MGQGREFGFCGSEISILLEFLPVFLTWAIGLKIIPAGAMGNC